MEIKTFTRKWGNSLGVRLPKELVKKKNLKENMEITIEVNTKSDLEGIWGMIEERKMSAQEMKDLSRKEEFEAEKGKWKK